MTGTRLLADYRLNRRDGLDVALSRSLKKSALKLLMPMQSLAHQCLEFWCGAKILQQRIAHEVGVAKESTLDAKTQHVQGGNLVTQNRIGLSDLVYTCPSSKLHAREAPSESVIY